MKIRKIIFACLLLTACTQPTLQDEWQDWKKQQSDNPGTEDDENQQEDVTDSLSFTYFAFLKEDNPELADDMVCTSLSSQNLLLIPTCELHLPCMLKPRFALKGGTLIYNGDEMVSGESEMYCSYNQSALIRIEGDEKKQYHSISFAHYTGLPVVEICSESSIRSFWQDATMTVHGLGKYADRQSDSIKIKRRGNSTANLPKTPFNIKFEKKTPLLGMAKGKRWCFLANYRDRSGVRNDIALELGHMADGMEWNPHSVFAELYFNGNHCGTYQVTEAIRQNEDRVPVEALEYSDTLSDVISGGYIFEVDDHFKRTYKFKTNLCSWPVNMRYPKDDDMNEAQFDYIQVFCNQLEAALVSGDFDVMRAQMDYPSFIDMFIVEQVMGSNEFCSSGSIYCYKKRNGKLYAGPLWDFEHQSLVSDDNQKVYKALWYPYLFADPVFSDGVKQRWPVLKQRFEDRIFDYIDERKSELALSATYNDSLYPLEGKNFLNKDENLTFDEAVDRLAGVLRERIQTTDAYITTLP